jgi:hypothetical protein
MGERWAIELCQDDYLATGYFSGEDQDSERWLYYRCRTEGQNTISYDGMNQIVDSAPIIKYQSNNGVYSTSFWIADLTAAYSGLSIKRGLRLLGGRTMVVIQDEISSAASESQWRMHTKASIQYSESGNIACESSYPRKIISIKVSDDLTTDLTLNGKIMEVYIVSPPKASFKTVKPIRNLHDPPLPEGEEDLPNTGISVLAVDIPSGNHTVAIIFSPVWDSSGEKSLKLSNPIPLEQWSLASHQT